MLTRIFAIVVAILCVIIFVVGGIWLLGARTVSSDQLERSIPSTVIVGRQPFTVTAQISLLPYARCTEGAIPLDVVVLIDASDSMAGEPVSQAAAGALRFLATLDLTRNHVAVGVFNAMIVDSIGLTDDQDRLTQLLQRVAAGGGTDVNAALTYAQTELSSLRRRFNALPIVLLFSDGGSTNESALLATARRLKADGVQIFVVGLQGDDYREDLLNAVATDRNFVRTAPSPAELVDLFEGIALFVGNYALTDLNYTEPVAYDNFTVDASTLPSEVTVSGDGLTYHADVMTQAQAEHFGGFPYQLIPEHYGYRNITASAAQLSLTACGADVSHEELPPGPRVLILPPLPWLLGIPAALLLLVALPFLQWHRSTDVPPGPENDKRKPDTSYTSSSGFPLWLERAEDLEAETGRAPVTAMGPRVTLVVGLGSTGRTVIAQMAQNLTDRFGDRWPDAVQLLQISLPPSLDPAETLPLPASVTEVTLGRDTNRLRFDQPHLRWAQGQQDGPRQRGRLALFADLSDGKENSVLWAPLGRVLANRTNIIVWLVTDAFGPASGMIADIAHLLRVRAGSGIIESMRLCLAMQNARWPNQPRNYGSAQHAYASLRELQRIQKTRNAFFAYTRDIGQQELRAVSKVKLFDDIYLFDGNGEDQNGRPYTISHLPAADGVLRIIANSLLALLERPLGQRFYENERNAQSEVSRAGETDLENYGSALGCAVVRAPIAPTRQLIELRLLHQALFDSNYGLFGWGELNADGTQRASAVAGPLARERDVEELMRQTAINPATPLEPHELIRRLTAYLEEKLNDSAPLRLRWAVSLLDLLQQQGIVNTGLDQIRAELLAWLHLVGETGATKPTTGGPTGVSLLDFSFDGAITAAEPTSAAEQDQLPHLWAQRWQVAREQFPHPTPADPEQLAWNLNQEAEFFNRYFPEPANVLARLRGRVYWLWSPTPKVELRLLILPNALSAPVAPGNPISYAGELRNNPYAHALTPSATEQLLDRLLVAARPFSRALNQEGIELYLKDRTTQKRLTANASPLAVRVERGAERVPSQSYRYLLLPPAMTTSAADVEADVRVGGSDPSYCVLLQAQHIIRLSNTQSYADAQRAYQPDAGLFVFEMEQRAALREKAATAYRGQRTNPMVLSPTTVALLDDAAHEIDQLGKLIVFDAIQLLHANGAWRVQATMPELASLANLPLKTLIESFVALVKDNPTIMEAIEQWLAAGQLDYAQRSKVQLQLDELVAAADTAAHDVAICIAWALENP